MPGVDPITATALVCAIGNGKQFNRGLDSYPLVYTALLGHVTANYSQYGSTNSPTVSKGFLYSFIKKN